MIWHSSEFQDVLKELEVDQNKGLPNGVADMRLQKYGRNLYFSDSAPSFKKQFFKQLNNKFVYILIVIALISFGISLLYSQKDFYSPLLIIAIVLANAAISAYYNNKSMQSIRSLKVASIPKTKVLRDGIEKEIFSDELVPGDIILLSKGDYISADARVIESNLFRCNDFAVTGSNIPVEKRENIVLEDITEIALRNNMVFAGCSVVSGSAKAVVVETGKSTSLARNNYNIEEEEDSLPLQNSLDSIGNIINTVILVICSLCFIISLVINFRSELPFASVTVSSFLNALALAVAAIPEGLPAISTISIALGIQRFYSDRIIIKNTKALQIIGNTNVICCDKTGIITKNHMDVTCVFDGNNMIDTTEKDSATVSQLLKLATACTTLDNDYTEISIAKSCFDYTLMSSSDIDNAYPRLAVVPFDSERKTMTSINMIGGKTVAIVKGAPEILVKNCVNCNQDKILRANEIMASNELRVICIAIKHLNEVPANPVAEEIETDLQFAGLIGLYDPPRDESVDGIEICKNAGIKTIMITGDSVPTATAVARRVGILTDDTKVISGEELKLISNEQLFETIEDYSVYARISPEDKIRIIEAWQNKGKTVAVTGDGIEDAQALQKADVGCAVGKYSTDVSKGSADIIIENSLFSSIITAIKESRGFFANIKKCVSYLLSCNIAELLCYFLVLVIFGKAPFAAVQLLLINLLTDLTPIISLCTAKTHDDVLCENRNVAGRLFDKNTLISIILHTLFITLITIVSFVTVSDYTTAMTMAFVTMGLGQIFHSFNKFYDGSLIYSKIKKTDLIVISSIAIIFIISFLSLTPAGVIFGLGTLNFMQYFVALLLGISIIPFGEIIKIVLPTAAKQR